MNWTRRRLAPVERENAGLRMVIIQLRRELENKEGAVGRLELLVRQRTQTIDALRDKLEQARVMNQRLGLQNEVLVAMIAAPDAAMLAAK